MPTKRNFSALLYFTFVALLIVSCKKDAKVEEGNIAYLGGEIINPSNKNVIIYKDKIPLDTLKLNKDNRFIYKFTQLVPGLYTFHHGTDIQMVLLEPNDSIMLRLNTIDFDESLVYTGEGAKKNNFLINMFLASEKEDKEILKFCQQSADVFEKYIDSIRSAKNEKLETFSTKYAPSGLFLTIAKANIDYNYYTSKEVYPFAYYSHNQLKNLNSLPEDFYDYRKGIDYNNEILKDYFPYFYFLRHHFRNIAAAEHFKQSSDSIFNPKSVAFNLIKMKLIDSLVSNEGIKNNLLTDTAFRFFNYGNSIQANDSVLNTFLSLSTDSSKKELGIAYTNRLKKLAPGNPIPDVSLIDTENKTTSLQTIIKKPTVIYFWSYTIKTHFKDSHEKIAELQKKYPEIDVISININDGDPDFWVGSLKQYNFSLNNEYRFSTPDQAKETLALYPINKVILTDKKGVIEKSNANMFSYKFEEELLGLLSR